MTAKREDATCAERQRDRSHGSQATDGERRRESESEFFYVRVADRAYYMWLDAGMPERGAMDYWVRAEAEELLAQQAWALKSRR